MDFPRTLERFAGEFPREEGHPAFTDSMLSYPDQTAVYRGALEVLKAATAVGTIAVVSDGDTVFQAAKIARARIAAVLSGPVLIFDHKEEHVDEVERVVPAAHYVMFDDRPRIHRAMKARLGRRITTVLVPQGHYARAEGAAGVAAADLAVESIEEILTLDLAALPERRSR